MKKAAAYGYGKRWFLLPVFLLLCVYVRAQDEIVPDRHYDRSNGLPAKKMYNVCLDRDGFLWFAAENGIFRFDGKTFHAYTTKDGLCDNDIIELYAYPRNGSIWCAGYNGRISVIENGVVNTEHPVVKNWNSLGFIYDIVGDSLGNMYMAGEEGELFRVDTLNRISRIKRDKQTSFLSFYKRVYGMSNNEMMEWDADARKIRSVLCWDTMPPRTLIHLSRGDGSIWISTTDHKLKEAFGNTQVDLGDLDKDRLIFVARVSERHLLVGFFRRSTFLYDLVSKKSWKIRLPENARVVDAIRDRQGNIWLSAYRDGLFALKPPSESPASGHFLPGFDAYLVGAYRFQGKTFAVDLLNNLYVEENGRVTRFTLPLKPGVTWTENASFVPCGDSLFFSSNKGQLVYHRGRVWPLDPLPAKAIWIYKDSLYFVRTSYRVLQKSLHENLPPLEVCEERTFSGYLQGDRLWISVKDGLTYYDIREGKRGPIVFEVPQNGRVEAIKPFTGDVLALATSNHGILFVRNGHLLESIDISDGLFDDDCKELLVYPGGLVVRHPLGLSHVDFARRDIRALSQWKDMPVSSVNHMCLYGDTMLFSTSQGLMRVRLDELFRKVPETRTVKILRVMGEGVPIRPENIDLAYDRNKLKIDFALPEYDQPYMVQYYWRINDGAWNKTAGTSLELADLRSGDYVLELKARAPGFDFSPVSVLRFHVRTPFWRTWWFMAALVAALVGFIWILLRRRYIRKLRTEREKASIRHQLITFEQKALNAMMNPHFVFNAMGSIQHYLNTGQNQQANDYLVKFSRLIRKSLETSQQEFCALDDEIERLTLYLQLEKMRLGDKLVFHIDVDEELDPEQVRIPTMILQTYVENAIIHGVAALRRGGSLNLYFRSQENGCLISIEDNGPGFDTRDKAKQNIRFGLSATEKRLELLTQITGKRYRAQVHSPLGPGGGTRVELFFPI